MKPMVWMLISLTMILTLTGCSKESMTLSRMTLPENQMEEQAINQSVQGKSKIMLLRQKSKRITPAIPVRNANIVFLSGVLKKENGWRAN
ncbi:MAG: hypothetical protein KHY90_01620 [Clostridium sp.]|nr:hypothetical protein [Clostridium sp.]